MTRIAILKRTLPAMIVLGALALGGCSGTNVGSSWQCPLAQGGTCDSVAGADPAVPGTAGAQSSVLRSPLYRSRGAERAGTTAPDTPDSPSMARSCRADCDSDFDPFGWLVRLFEADPGSGAGARDDGGDDSRPADAGPMKITPGAGAAPAHTAGADPAIESAIETSALSGAPEPGADLRTEEVVARIWIAPFVDAGGVYREASHVRVVLEPAGWRLR